jgi:hypothetical protein
MAQEVKPAHRNRYARIVEQIFRSHFRKGIRDFIFERQELVDVARQLGITLPKNLGDVVYSFRYRATLPESIRAEAPEGETWVIRPAGHSRYQFALVADQPITPNLMMSEIKVPDCTPGIVAMYSFNDEQALLAKVRYNRLIDLFTGATCYSLQNHLRTTLPSGSQVETDELYVGVDRRGVHYVFPVQAKGGTDRLGVVQIEQDFALCAARFPGLTARPIAAQFMQGNLIALFEFEEGERGVTIAAEKHYRLVAPDEITPEDLETYRIRPP